MLCPNWFSRIPLFVNGWARGFSSGRRIVLLAHWGVRCTTLSGTWLEDLWASAPLLSQSRQVCPEDLTAHLLQGLPSTHLVFCLRHLSHALCRMFVVIDGDVNDNEDLGAQAVATFCSCGSAERM
eukprot:3374070-Rhodomonas_salina.2